MPYSLRVATLDAPTSELLRYQPDAFVQWDDAGRITSVGPWAGESADEHLPGALLTPGFVDAHVHFPQTRIVGAASGPLLDWLARSTFPEETRFADAPHAAAVAARFADQLVSAGTTLAMVYSSVHPGASELLFAALEHAGVRAIAGPVLMDQGGPPALMLEAPAALDALQGLVDRWHGRDGRLFVAAIPRFALSCTTAMMRGAGELAQRSGLWVTTHFSENLDECAATTKLFAAEDYLSVYEDCGLIHDRCVLAHCIHPSEREWRRLADAQVVVAHCPDSNDFLGSGGMPFATVRDLELPLALGTDIAAGRTFRVPRIASSAFDNALRQGVRTAPTRWLWAATRGGAVALGMDEVGTIEVGMEADLALHQLPEDAVDAESALAGLFFNHDAPAPLRTWVRGAPTRRHAARPIAG